MEFFKDMHNERKEEAKYRHEQNLAAFNRTLDILEKSCESLSFFS